jgi:hypothetical protein
MYVIFLLGLANVKIKFEAIRFIFFHCAVRVAAFYSLSLLRLMIHLCEAFE